MPLNETARDKALYQALDSLITNLNVQKGMVTQESVVPVVEETISHTSITQLSDVSLDQSQSGKVLAISEEGKVVGSNPSVIPLYGSEEEPIIMTDLVPGIYKCTGTGKMTADGDIVGTSDGGLTIVVDKEGGKKGMIFIWEDRISTAIVEPDGTYEMSNFATLEQLDEGLEDVVRFGKSTYEVDGEEKIKKFIKLGNHDGIVAKSVDGTSHAILQLNRWDVVDVGNTRKQLTLNTDKEVIVQTPKTTENPFGMDFVVTSGKLFKVVLSVDEGSTLSAYDGAVVFDGPLGDYATITVHVGSDDLITGVEYKANKVPDIKAVEHEDCTATTVEELVADYNSLLAKLRTTGILSK